MSLYTFFLTPGIHPYQKHLFFAPKKSSWSLPGISGSMVWLKRFYVPCYFLLRVRWISDKYMKPVGASLSNIEIICCLRSQKKSITIIYPITSHRICLVCQAGGGSETIDTSEEEQNSWSASDQEVKDLSEMAVKIEKHYGRPMDWGIFCFCWVSVWSSFLIGASAELEICCDLCFSCFFSFFFKGHLENHW